MEENSEHLKLVFENIQNLLAEDQTTQLASIRKLGMIVTTLGAERTVNELLPYMKEILESNKEVLFEFCDELVELPVDFSKILLRLI